MDWQAAIVKNREALKQVLAEIVTMAGPAAQRPATIARLLHRAVLRLLRPAEAAARRLVIVAARGIEITLPAVAVHGRTVGEGRRSPSPRSPLYIPCLPLFDSPSRFGRPRQRSVSCIPRISFPGLAALSPVRRPPMPFDQLDANRLTQRLSALGETLDDLPRHALRFARWRARRDRLGDTALGGADRPLRFRRVWPLRPGRPTRPQSTRDHTSPHHIHQILDTVHGLATWALEAPDTS